MGPGLFLSRIASLNRGGVERQRRDAVHDRHHRARRAPRIVGLQIALADVTRIHPVLVVGRGERRNARPVVVVAIGAGERLEVPAQRASAADQVTLRGRRDHREVWFAPADRAVRVRPDPQVRALLQRLRAAAKERAHRKGQHLVEHPGVVCVRVMRHRTDRHRRWRGDRPFGAAPVPLAGHGEQGHVASEALYLLKV
jgi:hypothetical protein